MADSKNGGFPGHDEGTNRPPNVPRQCIREFGFHVCSAQQRNENPVNVKTPTGNTGKVEGQE